ncbi:protein-arginine deiminase type-3-like [Sceloporus undulatus]|uniref:protein-arginine deiminase type-3-like n=1 Tax=Sceloporus undulatus TaxID=8520 RepID=UPI001C4CC587|nr:protein-arginine deiminase type-3-like [Sceloporus undulatus]
MVAKQRVIRVSTEQPNYAVCVLGIEVSIDIYGSIPKGSTSFDVRGTAGVGVYVVYNPEVVTALKGPSKWPLDVGVEVRVTMKSPSKVVNDNKVRVSYYGPTGQTPIASAWLYITCMAMSLDADTGRTGMVESKATNKTKWTWGPNGEGAILLVNCDRDGPSSGNMDNAYPYVRSHADLQDLSLVVLNTEGPADVFESHTLLLHISMFDATRVRVFQEGGNASLSSYEHILGSDKLSHTVGCKGGKERHAFYVEGLAFPDADFKGLVYLNATLLERASQNSPATPVFTETVVFRVAPWLMTSSTMKPLEIFVCSIKKGHNTNEKFLEAIKALAEKAGCKLTVCPEMENRGDRWIQDEMEFGYVEAPHKTFPVVFDSPRNRGLVEFPFKKILGPDFGYVTREPKNGRISSLDSFGNLDLSPPVKVKGKEYPLGRILIGSSFPGSGNRKMAKIVRDFLYAQKVQSPVELYSDWLTVGHVDEFLSFVPAPDRKGFRLLLASPLACLKLFKEKQKEGYGNAALFEGLGKVGKITLDELLEDRLLRSDSKYVQSCIDWNRSILKRELGLSERDIIDIPQLFTLEDATATALFPDMVNMVVLGKHLGIPKPFGPIIHGQCCLEANVRSLLEPLGLSCTFIDDFFSYHVLSGEIHCGTNVCRAPFSFHWWNIIP